jgi:hypothetical protein
MDLPDDLTDRLRDAVHRSRLPGAEMPRDDEGLFGRVDAVALDKALNDLGRRLYTYVPAFSVDSRYQYRPGSMDSLQLLAPLWPKAEEVRKVVARRLDNPTINSIEASIRRKTLILSHVPGHESQAPAKSGSWTTKRLARIVAGFPALMLLAFVFLHYVSDRSCFDCPISLYDRVFNVLPYLVLMTAVLLCIVVLPGVVVTLWMSRRGEADGT